MIAPFLPEHIEVKFVGLRRPQRDLHRVLSKLAPSLVILLKGVGDGLEPEVISRLRDTGAAIGIDHKDGDPARVDFSQFDFHIASSFAGLRALDAYLSSPESAAGAHVFAEPLFQGPDSRLATLSFKPLEKVSTVYLGRRAHAVIPQSLEGSIAVIEVKRSHHMKAAIRRLPDYNLHFAVRPASPDILLRGYTPFTKGVVAAACNSNILVTRDTDDAVDFLTPDYPYLLAGNGHPEIEEGLRMAAEGSVNQTEDFGGPEWNRGLELMRALRERVSARVLASQFTHIVARAMG